MTALCWSVRFVSFPPPSGISYIIALVFTYSAELLPQTNNGEIGLKDIVRTNDDTSDPSVIRNFHVCRLAYLI